MTSLLKTVPGLRVSHEREGDVHLKTLSIAKITYSNDGRRNVCAPNTGGMKMTENNTPEHTLIHFRQIKVARTSPSRDKKKLKRAPVCFLRKRKCNAKQAEEYCWAITRAAGRSCCGRSVSSVMEFGFKQDSF